jgi:hypothetical protein
MTTQTEWAKAFGETLGFKGRLAMLLYGIVGLFFPGIVMYSLLVGLTKGLKDYDVQKLIKELQE